jgi:hypothetical protein
VLLYSRDRVGFREGTVKGAVRFISPCAIFFLCTVVKIYGAVLGKDNPTSTMVKFAAVFWFRVQYNFTIIIRWANGDGSQLSVLMADAEGVRTERHEDCCYCHCENA